MEFGKSSDEVMFKKWSDAFKDPFVFFFTKWVEKTSMVELMQNRNYFLGIYQSQKYKIWRGYAFENLAHNHILELKDALGIGAVFTTSHYWRYVPKNTEEQGVQIDLLIIRADGVANIIECKFTNKPFVITKKYAYELENKATVFNEQTNHKFMTTVVMLTLNGVKENEYSGYLLGDDMLIGDIV